MKSNKFYYIITSSGSRYSYGGIGKISLAFMDKNQIIDIAQDQSNKLGKTLYTLKSAVKELSDEGRIYEIFDSKTEKDEFVVRAKIFNLEDEALMFSI